MAARRACAQAVALRARACGAGERRAAPGVRRGRRPARADRRSLRRRSWSCSSRPPASSAGATRSLDALVDATGCADVFERSDSATCARSKAWRRAAAWLRGARAARTPRHPRARRRASRSTYDAGHKTGFYLDQRDNRELAVRCGTGAPRAARRRGAELLLLHGRLLDRAGRAAARQACCRSTRRPMRWRWRGENLAPERPDRDRGRVARGRRRSTRCARCAAERPQFDLIVLDPPKFAASHHHVDRAARAYKDINLLRAAGCSRRGGCLLTFSCSGGDRRRPVPEDRRRRRDRRRASMRSCCAGLPPARTIRCE
ncbi:MAG: hypothetical protein MZW92_48900 [Comamonadaceae bacterium]|nr:hypothetical protein [Comamonadaceae bacterium]